MAARKKGSQPTTASLDRRALRALFGTYWTAGGWRGASGNATQTPPPPAAEVAYARAAGYLLDPRPLTHDRTLSWLRQVRASVTRRQVTDAFLASLSTRRLDWRSALGSFAVARHLPDHPHPGPAGASFCGVCGFLGGPTAERPEDLSVLNFERFKWGGVRHVDPVYAALDLELFGKGEKPTPRLEDFDILNRILGAARVLDPGARLDHLQKALAQHLPSSKDERRMLIQVLGYCGVLQHPDHPGFLHGFRAFSARPGSGRGDWTYPVEHWRGQHGVNAEALGHWFGEYEQVRP
jgi:hypothetical protein